MDSENGGNADRITQDQLKVAMGVMFTEDMIMAFGDNLKSQTRRTNGLEDVNACPNEFVFVDVDDRKGRRFAIFNHKTTGIEVACRCPYGKPGSIIYAKEVFTGKSCNAQAFPDGDVWWHQIPPALRNPKCVQFLHYKSDNVSVGTDNLWPGSHWRDRMSPYQLLEDEDANLEGLKWTSSMLMKKWASRFVYRLKNVRVERVMDITDADAQAEGIWLRGMSHPSPQHKAEFWKLWNQIHEPRGHGTAINPYCWVLDLRNVFTCGAQIEHLDMTLTEDVL